MHRKPELGLTTQVRISKSQTTSAPMVKPLDLASNHTITFVQFKLPANVNKISYIKKKARRMSHPSGALHIIDESLSLISEEVVSSKISFLTIIQ